MFTQDDECFLSAASYKDLYVEDSSKNKFFLQFFFTNFCNIQLVVKWNCSRVNYLQIYSLSSELSINFRQLSVGLF